MSEPELANLRRSDVNLGETPSLPGTLAGTGTCDRPGRGAFAVVGGTGAFVGACGACTVEQRRLDPGRSGHVRIDVFPSDEGPSR